MDQRFEKNSKYFFWASGVVTTLGALPTMLSPVGGLKLTTGLTYSDQSPQLCPLIGHWGMMVAGIGILLFLSATNKQIRKTSAIFATLEKAYLVGFALYGFLVHAPYAMNYLSVLIIDGTLTIGGIWYLLRSSKLKQD